MRRSEDPGTGLPASDGAPHLPVPGGAPRLPAPAQQSQRQFGAYVHIPFCTVRCGYCDFNTYTAPELRGLARDDYPDSVRREIALARATVGERPISTVFFGGGTPTLLAAGQLVGLLRDLDERFGIVDGAEVTVEANPDTVTRESLESLRRGGVTRMSFGMQSAVPEVLATLDRTHDPSQVPEVVRIAQDLGFETSVDLIYGAPGETLEQWRTSIDAALALEPHHISAYALIVEPGTALARRIRRGEIAPIDDDLHAEMYELADTRFTDAGYEWYELSNWSKAGAFPSRHNLAYWHDTDWWGFGPGAHSHLDGVRFWNVKHPAAYADRLAVGDSPEHEREVLSDEQRLDERVLLRSRLREGLPTTGLPHPERVAELIADGLVDPAAALAGRVVLTRRGRLLADVVARTLS